MSRRPTWNWPSKAWANIRRLGKHRIIYVMYIYVIYIYMQSTFRTTETYWIFHSKKRWKLSEKSSSCIDQRPGQKMYNLAAVKMNSRACQSQTRLRKRCFSNKVSSDHLTFALYHCIPLFSFPGCKESLCFLSWTPCRCLISVRNSPQKKRWIYHSKLEKLCSQKSIPCLWAIIHRHILSSNSSRLDASNMGKHVQVGKMHQFFWINRSCYERMES